MLGQVVGTYLGGTAAFFPFAPSPMPIESNLNEQQGARAVLCVQVARMRDNCGPGSTAAHPACAASCPCRRPSSSPPARAVGTAQYILVNSECYDTSKSSGGSSNNTVWIVVGTVCGVLLPCGVALGIYAWRRKQRRRVTIDAEKGGSGGVPCDKADGALEQFDKTVGMEAACPAANGALLQPPASQASTGNRSASRRARRQAAA